MGLVGGWLADREGYRTIFTFTGYVWLVAAAMYAPLLWIVREDRERKGGG